MPTLPDSNPRGGKIPFERERSDRSVYDHRWRKKSKNYRSKNLFCEVWLALGKHIKGAVTDHIIRHELGGAFWLEENWMVMSHFWHNRKSGLEAKDLIKIRGKEVRGGLVPVDRNEVIEKLLKYYEKELKQFL